MELISVIIPVYNVEKYLLRCVESVKNQSYKNLEIILVDDGSPDRCPEMCEDIKRIDSRVKVIHKINEGLGFARNSGLAEASGEYVAFIDSDDWLSEDHIENLYREAKKVNADVVIGGHTNVNSNGCEKRYSASIEKRLYSGKEIINSIVLPLIGTETNCPQDILLDTSSCMNLYRMAVIEQNNLRFLSERVAIAEDLYFNLDFFMHSEKIAVMDEFGYYYFMNDSSISRRYDSERFHRTLNFYATVMKQMKEYRLDNRIGKRVERTYLLKIRVLIRQIVFSNLPKKQKFKQIQNILSHSLTKKILETYPIESFPLAIRILAQRMRAGDTRGIYWLVKWREVAKQQLILNKIVKWLGIGK